MSALTLSFRSVGEEAIVRKAVVDAYARVLEQIDINRKEATELNDLHVLADMCDYAQERHDRLYSSWRRALARFPAEELEHQPSSIEASS